MKQKKESLGKRNVSDMTFDEQNSLAKELKNEFTKNGARIFNCNDYRLPNGEIDSTRLAEDIVDDTFLTPDLPDFIKRGNTNGK